MKKYLLINLFIINLLFANTSNLFNKEELNYIQNSKKIKIGIEKDWPPFDFIEDGEYKGLAKDYLDELSKISGLSFEYIKGFTWQELLIKAKKKELHLLPILAKNEDREKFLNYTNSYLSIRDYLFSSNKNFYSLKDLKHKTIAIPNGYIQEKFIQENYPEINILKVNNILEAIDAVLLKNADALISNTALISYYLKEYNIVGINAQFSLEYSKNDLFMATNKKEVLLRNIINKSLQNIPKKKINAIKEKWISSLNLGIKFTKEEKNYIKHKKSLLIGNEIAYKPYDYNENNKAKGYSIDYIKLVLSKNNLEAIFIKDDWPKLLEKIRNKKIDVLPIIKQNKQRQKYINFSPTYLQEKMTIVTKKDRHDIINIDDLNGRTIALGKNWYINDIIKKEYPNIKFLEFNNTTQIFEALKNNYVDALILDYLSANYYIKNYYLNILKIAAFTKIKSYDNNIHLGIKKDDKILNQILNKSVKMINPSELKALNDKWLNINNKIVFSKEEQEFIRNTIIKASSTNAWAPFNFIEDDKKYGISYDFWQYVINKANLKTQTTFISSFTEVLDNLKNKKIDLIIGTSETPDRKNYSIFSNIYQTAPLGIATLKDENFIQNASFLLGKKVAVGKNYTAHKLLEKSFPGINFVFIKNIQEGLELLSEKKVFALVDIMPVLSYNISKKSFTNIRITGHTGLNYDLRFMIRKDYPLLSSIINKVLGSMSLQERENIYKKWINVQYQKSFDYSLLWKTILFFSIILFIILYKHKQLLNTQKKLKNTQENLKLSLENFKDLINSTMEALIIIKNGKIVFSNEEAVSIFLFKDKKYLLNKNVQDIFELKNINNFEELIKKVSNSRYEINGINKLNKKFPTIIKIKQLKYKKENAHIISIIDLSEIKEKENLILQQSKLASLGEMIGNIAHQWRQPLNSISITASGVNFKRKTTY